MRLTLKILTKTYCCSDNKDRNIFNEDLESEGNNNDKDEEEEKLVVKSVSSFQTEIND
jgi:hypothetical protein